MKIKRTSLKHKSQFAKLSKLTLAIVIALTFIAAVALWSGSTAQSVTSARAPWEYKVIYDTSEKTLNKLGEDGWEVVATTSPSSAGLGNNVPTVILKRRK